MSRKIVFISAACIVCIFFISAISFIIKSEKEGIIKEPVVTDNSSLETTVTPEQNSQATVEQTKPATATNASTDFTDASKYFYGVTSSKVYNNELQFYLSDQTSIKGNKITFTAEKLGERYISGKVQTKQAFRYGKFAFRINLVKGKGLFPAIWMLPQTGELFPETDIFEQLGNDQNQFFGVIHFIKEDKQQKHNFGYKLSKSDNPESLILGFEWTKNTMVWTVNGKVIQKIDKDIPQTPAIMIMNLAVGGNWPGSPDSNTKFPAKFNVEILKFEPVEIYP